MNAWLFHTEASSRSSALIRICLPFLLWSRFAADFLPMRHPFDPAWWAVAASFYLSTTLMCLGIASRGTTAWAGLTVLLGLRYGLGYAVGHEPYTHHHVHVLGLATTLLALTPCGASYSVDRWLHPGRPERGNVWGLRLIVVLLTTVYLFGTLTKLTPAYLSGDRMEHYFVVLYFGSDYPAWPGFAPLMLVGAWFSVLVEPFVALGLWWKRIRGPALAVGAAFHALIYLTLPVATFSLTMVLLYLAAFDPDDVHDIVDRLQGYSRAAS